MGKRRTTERACNTFKWRDSLQYLFGGHLCLVVVHAWHVKSSLPDVNMFVCTLCASSLTFFFFSITVIQGQHLKNRISRPIISDSLTILDYSEVNTIVTPHNFRMWTKRNVWVHLYTVLWYYFCQSWLYCCDCCSPNSCIFYNLPFKSYF